jgi:hypothetical protein
MPRHAFSLDVPNEAKKKKFEQDYLETAQTVLKEQTVLRLHQDGKISTGTGAKMLGMPLYAFMRFLGQHRVSTLRPTGKELAEDFRASKRASKLVGKPRHTSG